MNSTVKLLTRGGRGETRLLLERDQKRDQAKSKALEISSSKFCHQLSTRKINLDFSLEQTRWLNIKMVDFGPKRNAFPPYWVFFFTPTLRVCIDGRRSMVRWLNQLKIVLVKLLWNVILWETNTTIIMQVYSSGIVHAQKHIFFWQASPIYLYILFIFYSQVCFLTIYQVKLMFSCILVMCRCMSI